MKNKAIDFHKMKGIAAGKELRNALIKSFGKPIDGDNELLDTLEKECRLHIERSSRMTALNRRKKAEKKNKTIDIFG